MGARLLPAVQKRQARLPESYLECNQLAECRREIRGLQKVKREHRAGCTERTEPALPAASVGARVCAGTSAAHPGRSPAACLNVALHVSDTQ